VVIDGRNTSGKASLVEALRAVAVRVTHLKTPVLFKVEFDSRPLHQKGCLLEYHTSCVANL
jgi:hypothetical protein